MYKNMNKCKKLIEKSPQYQTYTPVAAFTNMV